MKQNKLLKCYFNKKSDCFKIFELQDWANKHHFNRTTHYHCGFWDDRYNLVHNYPLKDFKINHNDVYSGLYNATQKICTIKGVHRFIDDYIATPTIGTNDSKIVYTQKELFSDHYGDIGFWDDKKNIKV